MTAPSFGAFATTVSAKSTTCTFNTGLPTRTQGDLLVMTLGRTNNTSTISTVPTGFVYVAVQTNAIGSNQDRMYIKEITASEPSSYTWSWSGSSNRFIAELFTVTGADINETFWGGSYGPANSDTLNFDNSGTIPSGDYLSILSASWLGKNESATGVTNYTTQRISNSTGGGSPTTHRNMGVWTRELTGVTSISPGTSTLDSQQLWQSLHVVLTEPAVAADSPPPFLRRPTTLQGM